MLEEKVEPFTYIVNDTEERAGTRRVLTLDLGGGVTMDLVRIRAGQFTMGSPPDEKDRDADEAAHEVTLTKDFYLGKYEVTQEQYEAVTGSNPSHFKGRLLPVESVNLADAAAFCVALGEKVKRLVELPSEAQWEYACRAGTTTTYHFGSKLDPEKANTDKGASVNVGSYEANGFGLHDMHGNVKESCQDSYGPYDELAGTTDPIQATRGPDHQRILRGGSWYLDGRECRAADRVPCGHGPDLRAYDIGMRVCLGID
ncbi:MAG TPA: formylglycine-generating enzyme family protein [Planctomycetota bacterium]|nr:formylglycine-generating enzyme family protein [Planctomycetota bacterium]